MANHVPVDITPSKSLQMLLLNKRGKVSSGEAPYLDLKLRTEAGQEFVKSVIIRTPLVKKNTERGCGNLGPRKLEEGQDIGSW